MLWESYCQNYDQDKKKKNPLYIIYLYIKHYILNIYTFIFATKNIYTPLFYDDFATNVFYGICQNLKMWISLWITLMKNEIGWFFKKEKPARIFDY